MGMHTQQEEKQEVETSNVAALAEKEKVTGLLSRAFRQPQARSVSLHNLLDVRHDEQDATALQA
jgi:hypothetical protein